jgi:hypothetical protein
VTKKRPEERKRPQIGDVVEIQTLRGFAYAQYAHNHRDPPQYGELLRVLPGLYPQRRSDFADLVVQEERFWVFFPLGPALNRGIFRIVANEAVPEAKRRFPIFGSLSGDGTVWWMWDGKREWKARSPRQRTPRAIQEIWNDTLLVERIADVGWTPGEEDY